MDGQPPRDFACEAEAQNTFLHEQAWQDQQNQISSTFLAIAGGICVGFITLASDGVDIPKHLWPLGGHKTRYAASKILQMAVDRRHEGRGYGGALVTFSFLHAIWVRRYQAIRYVITDSVPGRVSFYRQLGFWINKHEQRERRKEARARDQDPDSIAVRMVYDLNELKTDLELLVWIDSIFD